MIFTLRYVRHDYKTMTAHRATFSVSTNIPPFSIIWYRDGIPRQLFLLTTNTQISCNLLYRSKLQTRHDSRRKVQLGALIAHGVSNRTKRSDPQRPSTFSAHQLHAASVFCRYTTRNAYSNAIRSVCLNPPWHKASSRLRPQLHTMHYVCDDS